MLQRLSANPLLSPEDVRPTRDGLEVLCTLNPAAVRFGGQTLLLVRVGERLPDEPRWVTYLYRDPDFDELQVGRYRKDDPDLSTPDGRGYFYRGKMVLSSLSHLRIARSDDGERFVFDDEPAIFPATPYEAFGCEDARITFLDGRYWIAYTAVSTRGVAVALASTDDFRKYRREGILFPPYQKDVCLFPETVGGRYVCRHRPYMNEFNNACIWTAYSPDRLCWGYHAQTLAPTPGTWEADRVGCGAPPVKSDEGWLELYHAADANGRYCLGAMLSDPDAPHRLLSRSRRPVLEPTEPYERHGVHAETVFSNGLIVDDDGTMTVFYGAADRTCCAARTTADAMLAAAGNRD
jgi:beta-1,2-mannobiose phosphorylase / 1,2-beta-oligomannan phosphorylase